MMSQCTAKIARAWRAFLTFLHLILVPSEGLTDLIMSASLIFDLVEKGPDITISSALTDTSPQFWPHSECLLLPASDMSLRVAHSKMAFCKQSLETRL